MQKSNTTYDSNSIFNSIEQFNFPENQSFLKKSLLYYKQGNFLSKVKYFEEGLIKYPHIFKKDSRSQKASDSLKYFAWFFCSTKTPFKPEIAFETLILIFLIDDIADDSKLSISYRKNFLKKFSKFIKGISPETKIDNIEDIAQEEMQKIWLNYFKKVCYWQDSEKDKWIEASCDLIQAMLNELKNKKYKSMELYLENATLSSGALFFWQSMAITINFKAKNNIQQYNKLTKKVATILRLSNDFVKSSEDENKVTALDFCDNKNELNIILRKELTELQKMVRSPSINEGIRIAMWRSAVFLYYFYQKDKF